MAGNPGGPGNPYGRETAKLRQLIREAVTGEDLLAIVRSLVDAAKGGDLAAIRELLNRLIGRPGDETHTDRLARGDAHEERWRRLEALSEAVRRQDQEAIRQQLRERGM